MVSFLRPLWLRLSLLRVRDSVVIGFGVWCLVLLASNSYRALPLAEDPAIHFTGIHQAILRHEPFGRTWTFRGPIYNAYLAMLYRGATLFSSFDDPVRFSNAVKSIHLVFLGAAAFLWGHGLSRSHPFLRRWRATLVGIALLSLLLGPPSHTLHAEDVAGSLLFSSSGLAAHRSPKATLAGGVLCALLPLLKGTTALLCIPAAASLLLLRRARLQRSLAFVVGAGASLVAQLLYFSLAGRTTLNDLIEAGVFQGANATDLETLRGAFGLHWQEFLARHALLPLSLAATCAMLPHLVVTGRIWWAVGLSLHWCAALLLPFVQGKYFTYHFAHSGPAQATAIAALFFLNRERLRWRPALLSLLGGALLAGTLLSYFDDPWPTHRGTSKTTPLFAIAALLFVGATRGLAPRGPRPRRRWSWHQLGLLVALGMNLARPVLRETRESAEKNRARVEHLLRDHARMRALEKDFGLAGKKLLFLTYGTAVRHSRSLSVCRHFFPIPVQRLQTERLSEFESTRGFRENRECIFSYRGRWVLLEPRWMLRGGSRSKIRRFLRDYRVVRRLDDEGLRSLVLLERRRL